MDYIFYACSQHWGEIIQYFDNRAERAIGAQPSDGVVRDLESGRRM
jgi:hypothetical protein